ncbi:MAG: hypothetical protein GX588_01025, partial [Clostridiaceae bacterium]|nr:hypothetical protein [Clostridiaceae bacterium]
PESWQKTELCGHSAWITPIFVPRTPNRGKKPSCVATPDTFIDSIMLKDSTMEETTSYTVVFWDAANEVYTPEATYANETDIAAALADLKATPGVNNTTSYISSKVANTTIDFDQLGNYELTFNVETVQSVSEAASAWLSATPPPTTDLVTSFLNGFVITTP